MAHLPKPFVKPACAPQQLLEHLQGRGLHVPDSAKAIRALSYIGYYRLLIYMRPLQTLPAKTFAVGTTFDDILQLYHFDRELRLLCLDAVERIEVSLRAAINNVLALKCGPHFYLETAHFQKHDAFVEFLRTASSAKYLAITHYHAHYNSPSLPPIWAITEAISFGALSRLFSGLHQDHRKAIAVTFRYDEEILVSWLRSLAHLRNMCAHHNRLWNATLQVDQPRMAKAVKPFFGSTTNTFYARALVTVCILEVIDPGNSWKVKLKALLATLPSGSEQHMGFPPNWRGFSVWA